MYLRLIQLKINYRNEDLADGRKVIRVITSIKTQIQLKEKDFSYLQLY